MLLGKAFKNRLENLETRRIFNSWQLVPVYHHLHPVLARSTSRILANMRIYSAQTRRNQNNPGASLPTSSNQQAKSADLTAIIDL